MDESQKLIQRVETLLRDDSSISEKVPKKPEEPLNQDCCGCSCTPCVYDLYRCDMLIWAQECADILGLKHGKKEVAKREESTVMYRDAYQNYKITDIRKISDDTNIYRFALHEEMSCLALPPGSHLILRGIASRGTSISRQYTPISHLNALGYFDVMIKIYEHGKMSSFVRELRVGSECEWRGPFLKWHYEPNKYSDIMMLACGTGIAPMVQVCRAVLDNPLDETRIHLVFACRKYKDILLKDLLDEWTEYWNFKSEYVLSSSEIFTAKYRDKILSGERISQIFIEQKIGELHGRNFCVLVCGTKSFEKDMINYLKKSGVAENVMIKF